MNCSTAVQLLEGTLAVYRQLQDGADKFHMAESAVTLERVLPALLNDRDDAEGFREFVDRVRDDLAMAARYRPAQSPQQRT